MLRALLQRTARLPGAPGGNAFQIGVCIADLTQYVS
jgi:hypothetical protein